MRPAADGWYPGREDRYGHSAKPVLDPLGEGDGWQDWPAFPRVATTERARIRFLVSPPGASATARAKIRQVAEHEYRIMARLPSGGLLRPKDMVENDLGVGLVYPLDEKYQRLDLPGVSGRDISLTCRYASAGDQMYALQALKRQGSWSGAQTTRNRRLTLTCHCARVPLGR